MRVHVGGVGGVVGACVRVAGLPCVDHHYGSEGRLERHHVCTPLLLRARGRGGTEKGEKGGKGS